MKAAEQAVQVIEAGRHADRADANFQQPFELVVVFAGGCFNRHEFALHLIVANREERLFRFVNHFIDWQFFVERELADAVRGAQHFSARRRARHHLAINFDVHSGRGIVDQAGQISLPADLVQQAHVLQFLRERHVIDGVIACLQAGQGVPNILVPLDKEVFRLEERGDAVESYRIEENGAEQCLLSLLAHWGWSRCTLRLKVHQRLSTADDR